MEQRHIELIANKCLIELEAMGVRVEIVNDVSKAQLMLESFGRNSGPANSPENLLLNRASSFWVFSYRYDKPLMTWGVRLDDLAGEDAQSFMVRSIEHIFKTRVVETKHGIFSGREWGRAAYFGDLKSNAARGLGASGQKMLKLLTAYIHHRTITDLRADITYCFLRGADASRSTSYNFLSADPFDWETECPMYPDGNPEWVMQLPKEKISSVMASVSSLLPQRLAIHNQSVTAFAPPNSASS